MKLILNLVMFYNKKPEGQIGRCTMHVSPKRCTHEYEGKDTYTSDGNMKLLEEDTLRVYIWPVS